MQKVVLEGADFEDFDRVQRVISESWVEHEMRPLGDPDGAAESRFAMVEVGPVKIAQMTVGGPVEVHTDHRDAYGVTTPDEGHLATKFGQEWVDSDTDQATLNSVNTELHIPRWEVPVFCFRVDSDYLEDEYERVLGRTFRRMPLQVDLATPEGRDWRRLVRMQYDQLFESESTLFDEPLIADQLASTMVSGLLLAAAPAERSDRLGTRPRIVRHVIAAIEEDPAHPWTPVELAERAGVSVRRLQQGFREYVGRSPFQYLRDVRLDRAHHDLVHAEEGTTVTDVALRWGLSHTGRFAADYRSRFGRSPSQTLSR